MNAPLRSYPRLRESDALEAFEALRSVDVDGAVPLTEPSSEGLAFYPMAPARVDNEALIALRIAIVDIATRCGYPGQRHADRTSGVGFEQLLAANLHTLAPMLPGEAADAEIWNFMTFRLAPDVAVWRYSLDDSGDTEPRAERFLGTRRGMFRQAWWRGYLLGAEACLQLTEDEFVQLVDRRGIVGYAPLARSVVDTHLDRCGRPGYQRRAAIREVTKLIRRELGRTAFDALDERVIDGRVRALFDQAEGLEVNDLSLDTREVLAVYIDSATSVRRFRDSAGEYLPRLSSSLFPMSNAESLEYAEKIREHAASLAPDPVAARIADDLTSLVGNWEEFGEAQTSLIRAAFDYFLLEHDDVPDHAADGLIDDDEVVDALFYALGLERGVGEVGI